MNKPEPQLIAQTPRNVTMITLFAESAVAIPAAGKHQKAKIGK